MTNVEDQGSTPTSTDSFEILDVTQSTHAYLMHQKRTLYLSSWISAIALSVGWLTLLLLFPNLTLDRNGATDLRTYITPFFAFILPLVVYSYYRGVMIHMFMQQLAQILHYTYEAHDKPSSLRGVSFDIGNSQRYQDVLKGMYQSLPSEIGLFSFTVPRGKSSETVTMLVFTITFPGSIPDLVLQPKSHGFVYELDHATPAGSVEVKLEGNFSDNFSLYAPPHYDVQIREIFEPALMALLIDQYGTLRVEMYRNQLHVMAPSVLNRQAFLAMRDLVDQLYTRILPHIREVQEDVVPPTPPTACT